MLNGTWQDGLGGTGGGKECHLKKKEDLYQLLIINRSGAYRCPDLVASVSRSVPSLRRLLLGLGPVRLGARQQRPGHSQLRRSEGPGAGRGERPGKQEPWCGAEGSRRARARREGPAEFGASEQSGARAGHAGRPRGPWGCPGTPAREVRDGAKAVPLGSSPPALPSPVLRPWLPSPAPLRWAPALPLPAPRGAGIGKAVISGARRGACLGLTLIIPS